MAELSLSKALGRVILVERVFLEEEEHVERLKDHQTCWNLILQFLVEEKKVKAETWEDTRESFAEMMRIYQRSFCG